jgi:hypothetical protein
MKTYKDLGTEVGSLVDEKNTAYGNSFNVAEDFIKLLWPTGVPPKAFNDMLCVVRIFDKLKRIAASKAYNGESPYRDIAGYALLGLMKDQAKPSWSPAESVVEDQTVWDGEAMWAPFNDLKLGDAKNIKKQIVSKLKKKKKLISKGIRRCGSTGCGNEAWPKQLVCGKHGAAIVQALSRK